MANKKSKKGNGWIKFFRIVIYAVSISGTVVGAGLIKTGGLSTAYADGTYITKIHNGEVIFFASLIVLTANIMWGILRWFLRGSREHWKAGQIIGKLIGGGLWRVLAIVPLILISLFFIAPKISNLLSAQAETKDETPISLSVPYESLKNLNDNFENLNPEFIENNLTELMLGNVDFDVDASSNISHKSSSFFFQNASAYSSTVTTLNRVKLSSAGHFVVFYTDTGDDKISDEKAAELAEMLETIITGYKNNLDFNFEYEKLDNNTGKLKKIQNVLKNHNIDENILDSAMPVYVVNPYKNGSNTLASYAGRRFKDLGAAILVKLGGLLGEETAKLYDTTPSYPFINILPGNADSESLAIVTAHELGHHYAVTYNYDTYGKTGSDDDFIDETAPNWMAIKVLPGQPAGNLINDNHYNNVYLRKSTSYKISEANPNFLGYPPVAFLENYYETVPNAKTIIMDAVYYGNALNYLYEKAGAENYKKVMVSLAEKNLTGDYNGKLINTEKPIGKTLGCTDICSRTYSVNPSATDYLYFTTSEYQNTKISFKGSNEVFASVLGLTYNGQYEVIISGKSQTEFSITETELAQYEVIAFAVASASLSENGHYQIDITAEELEDLLITTGNFDFSNLYSGLEPGCYEINTDSIFDNLLNLVDLGSDFISALNRLSSEDYSEAQNAYDAASVEAKNNIMTAKNELSPYRISVCANYVEGSSFTAVKTKLQSALKHNINIYNEDDGTDRLSIFVGFDLLTRSGKIHALAAHQNEMGLITITVEEK